MVGEPVKYVNQQVVMTTTQVDTSNNGYVNVTTSKVYTLSLIAENPLKSVSET